MKKFKVLIKQDDDTVREVMMMGENTPKVGTTGNSFGTEGLWEIVEVLGEVE